MDRIINLICLLPNLHKNIKGLLGNIEDNIKMYHQLKLFFAKLDKEYRNIIVIHWDPNLLE